MVYPVVPTLFARKCTRHFPQILISRVIGQVESLIGTCPISLIRHVNYMRVRRYWGTTPRAS